MIAGSKIELVCFHDKEAEASDFTEKTFYGPIWKQVRDALDYIKTNLIEEKVVKIDGKAEADRFFNYPYNALEEALVNAVLHRLWKAFHNLCYAKLIVMQSQLLFRSKQGIFSYFNLA